MGSKLILIKAGFVLIKTITFIHLLTQLIKSCGKILRVTFPVSTAKSRISVRSDSSWKLDLVFR